MFSYFNGGIKDTECSKLLDLPELVRTIQSNPHADKIDRIRTLRKKGDDSYKSLKTGLPYITPNCMVRNRNLDKEHFNQNFISFSSYMYFDIDIPNAEEYKQYFINHQQGDELVPVKNPKKKPGFMQKMMAAAEQQQKVQKSGKKK